MAYSVTLQLMVQNHCLRTRTRIVHTYRTYIPSIKLSSPGLNMFFNILFLGKKSCICQICKKKDFTCHFLLASINSMMYVGWDSPSLLTVTPLRRNFAVHGVFNHTHSGSPGFTTSRKERLPHSTRMS